MVKMIVVQKALFSKDEIYSFCAKTKLIEFWRGSEISLQLIMHLRRWRLSVEQVFIDFFHQLNFCNNYEVGCMKSAKKDLKCVLKSNSGLENMVNLLYIKERSVRKVGVAILRKWTWLTPPPIFLLESDQTPFAPCMQSIFPSNCRLHLYLPTERIYPETITKFR